MSLKKKGRELQSAIADLSRAELAEFREWFEEFVTSEWDRQIEEDVAAGRLDHLAEEALREYRIRKGKSD